MDFLHEITMVILQRQRARDPAGRASPTISSNTCVWRCLDRRAARRSSSPAHQSAGCADAADAVPRVGGRCRSASSPATTCCRGSTPSSRPARRSTMDGERRYDEIRGRVVAANAYLSACPVVDALRGGAHHRHRRTTDAALIPPGARARGGRGTIASPPASPPATSSRRGTGDGGNFTDWQRVPSMLDVGYPIAEVQADGEFVVTKHPNTGGLVSTRTVTEQLAVRDRPARLPDARRH
ncbi:MAG: acyclic terpene utilization AtuA family protein [Candidatus Binatia bacterium]